MDREKLTQCLVKAYEYFKGKDDSRNKKRVVSLSEKFNRHEYGVAFAGHFSAGKSRMINELLGENILPSSPVPTSANLVRVYRGHDYARVLLRNGKAIKYLAPYDYDLVRSYAKDGEQVEGIELSRSDINLPEGVVIMDTPGIDSADDAHRLATEDALHLADAVFYCMDYNHVQAEQNLAFTKALTDAGKDVYLVINQIDKHRSEELSFESFKQTAENAFASWGVRPKGFFYTSLKEKTHPNNQFLQLKMLLEELIEHRSEGLESSLQASLKKILDEHFLSAAMESRESIQWAYDVFDALSSEKETQLRSDYDRLSQEQKLLEKDWEAEYKAGVQRILDNAYLMPTSTRDLAKEYLIACQPDFKVGFFGRGKKTMVELSRRREAFFSDAAEKAKTQIQWHLKTYLTEFVQSRSVSDTELIKRIQAIEILPPEELLTDAMRSGAKLTQDGSYVMNYTQNFAEGIKQVAKRAADDVKMLFAQALDRHQQERRDAIAEKLADMEEYIKAKTALEEEQHRLDCLKDELAGVFIHDAQRLYRLESILSDVSLDEEIISCVSGNEVLFAEEQSADIKGNSTRYAELDGLHDADSATTIEDDSSSKVKLLRTAELLNKAADNLNEIPAMKHIVKDLKSRAKRLEDKGFLVTLFGAFSAGKSSFANALLGEVLLPVSPNPTTAAINMIMPVDQQHPHGYVIVKLKSENMLLSDLNRAFSVFDISVDSITEAKDKARDILAESSEHQQQEKAFIRAFSIGVHDLGSRLGQEFSSDLQGFREYAAQEEKSCFVDWIKVYYSCPFTEQGITLVDTPGADSINARHTNMSFQFIRKSDVILYVTYYNHAFSKADREFVIQLGRVKDAFQLDKMFFIVNAIDLAENETEVQNVKDYICRQLKDYGVNKPQLFALSSRQLLQERLNGHKERSDFENSFYRFVNAELTDIVLSAANQEYDRAKNALEKLIALSSSSHDEKMQRKQQLKHYREAFDVLINQQDCQKQLHLLIQESNELIYYVKQRVFLRFQDFYREAFNPASLISGGNSRQQLRNALGQLAESIGFDLAQELRATVLRLDNYVVRLVSEWQYTLQDAITDISSELTIGGMELKVETKLEFYDAFFDINFSDFSKPLALYKNPKDFFEGGVTKLLQEELNNIFSHMADSYLAAEQNRIQSAAMDTLQQLYQDVLEYTNDAMNNKLEGYSMALSEGLSARELQTVYNKTFK